MWRYILHSMKVADSHYLYFNNKKLVLKQH